MRSNRTESTTYFLFTGKESRQRKAKVSLFGKKLGKKATGEITGKESRQRKAKVSLFEKKLGKKATGEITGKESRQRNIWWEDRKRRQRKNA